MKRWEYKSVVFKGDIDETLNEWGKRGWEAFALKAHAGTRLVAFFKREIARQAKPKFTR